MKQLSILFSLIFILSQTQLQANLDDAKKLSLEIIAAISDDIAQLIINKHHEKDPYVTKAHCINLVAHMAEIIALIIAKIKERKIIKTLELHDEKYLNNMIDSIVENLLQKIECTESA